MTDDALIARLQKRCHGCAADPSPCVICEAAERIAALAQKVAELERLQERNEGRVKAIVSEELLDRATKAEAEAKVLLALLDEVRTSGTEHTVPGRYAVMQIGLHLLASIDAAIAGGKP